MKRAALGTLGAPEGREGPAAAGTAGAIEPRFLKPKPGQERRNRALIAAMPPTPKRTLRTAGVVVRTEVDDDEVGDVIQDAVVGPVRRGEREVMEGPGKVARVSDVAVGAQRAAEAGLAGAMGAATAAVPPGWTEGRVVAARQANAAVARADGGGRAEGGWELDPAAVGIVAASVNRAVTAPGGSKHARDALMGAYRSAHEFFRGIAASADTLRYNFQPRETEHGVPGKLPFLTSVRFELASRAFDRMWALLAASRAVSGVDAYAQNLMSIGTVPREFWTAISTAAEYTKIARTPPLRLVMRGRTIDGGAGAPVANSFFFGTAHDAIEREILEATGQPELRYLMNPQRAHAALRQNPAFSARFERVQVQGAFDAARPGAQMEALGMRVTIPPANQGYKRGNVVLLLRSEYEPPAGGSGAPAERRLETDIILVGHVPDDSYFRPVPPAAGADVGFDRGAAAAAEEWRRVADIPASFVFYHGGAHERPDIDMHPAGHVVPTLVDRERGVYRYDWSVLYDLAWLERTSGHENRFHRVGNAAFRRVAAGYFGPQQGGVGATLTNPRLEVFVEHVPTPERLAAMRAERRQWVFDRALKAGDDPAERIYSGYFPLPRSFTAMRKFTLRKYATVTGGVVRKESPQGGGGGERGAVPPAAAGQMSREDLGLWSLSAAEAGDAFIASLLASDEEASSPPSPMALDAPPPRAPPPLPRAAPSLPHAAPSPVPSPGLAPEAPAATTTTTAPPVYEVEPAPAPPLGVDPDEDVSDWVEQEMNRVEGTGAEGEEEFDWSLIGGAYPREGGEPAPAPAAAEIPELEGARANEEEGTRADEGEGTRGNEGEGTRADEEEDAGDLLGDFDVGTTARQSGAALGGGYGSETDGQETDHEVLETEDEREQ